MISVGRAWTLAAFFSLVREAHADGCRAGSGDLRCVTEATVALQSGLDVEAGASAASGFDRGDRTLAAMQAQAQDLYLPSPDLIKVEEETIDEELLNPSLEGFSYGDKYSVDQTQALFRANPGNRSTSTNGSNSSGDSGSMGIEEIDWDDPAMWNFSVPNSSEVMEALVPKGKFSVDDFRVLMYIVCPVAILVFAIFEFMHKQWADVDIDQPWGDPSIDKEAHTTTFFYIFQGIGVLVKPFFWGWQNWPSWVYLSVICGITLALQGLAVLMMVWTNDFWTCIQQKNAARLMPVIGDFACIIAIMIMAGVYDVYIKSLFQIYIRRIMTEQALRRWLDYKSYYRLQLKAGIDNPDQRITEDVKSFVSQGLTLFLDAFSTCVQLCIFLPMLAVLSPPRMLASFYCPGWLVYFAIIFSGFGTVCCHFIARQLILVNFAAQKYEADFRYNAIQVRDHAESIALYHSEETEKGLLGMKFERIVVIFWESIKLTKRLSFFTIFYEQASTTLPYLLIAPSFFAEEVALGDMMMIFQAFLMTKSAFEFFLRNYSSLSELRAIIDRLQNFLKETDLQAEVVGITKLEECPEPGAKVAARGVTISLPAPHPDRPGRTLWQNADLAVYPGEFVLLSAPEGTGKSSFFRALAGLWPYCSGDAHVPEGALFVPQKSYIPQGSLKGALTYPAPADTYSDEDVRAAIDQVGIQALKDTPLTREANWMLALSGGEQQKVAICRVKLCKPSVLFMDEATSAISEDGTLEVYNFLKRPGVLPEGAAVISISHNVELLKGIHDKHYKYDAQQASWINA